MKILKYTCVMTRWTAKKLSNFCFPFQIDHVSVLQYNYNKNPKSDWFASLQFPGQVRWMCFVRAACWFSCKRHREEANWWQKVGKEIGGPVFGLQSHQWFSVKSTDTRMHTDNKQLCRWTCNKTLAHVRSQTHKNAHRRRHLSTKRLCWTCSRTLMHVQTVKCVQSCTWTRHLNIHVCHAGKHINQELLMPNAVFWLYKVNDVTFLEAQHRVSSIRSRDVCEWIVNSGWFSAAGKTTQSI